MSPGFIFELPSRKLKIIDVNVLGLDCTAKISYYPVNRDQIRDGRDKSDWDAYGIY
jgi:hypothetical protein